MNTDLIIRISAFIGILAIMAIWERMAPRRPWSADRSTRWIINLAMGGVSTLFIRVLLASGAVGAAVLAGQAQVGIFHQLDWPWWVELSLAVILLDLVVYFQHVLMHAVPILWRLHMVHHTDVDFDVTTGVRFHPLEILLSMVIKIAAVLLIGASPGAVVAFEVLLNATSMFNHSNVRIPWTVDRLLRWFLVTPDMHRIHHSVIPRETNRNFGFNLPWWDRVLGTYLPDPSRGQTGMTIGLEAYRDPGKLTWLMLMALPFLGKPGQYPTWMADETEVTQRQE
ncbi:sterol desaturase family protein [Candidatus Nitrospira allomarina]|uniref:Sterol desaturase family protein n=1 Tax=Candidatus Nitrospira allomarina TaxID=3020900 RepID=A0AA96JVX0_9BACT|nr:sterol desaturase family protein [Candidatus Nitrospira allomarina]WNM57331.1 sterol desaturase family protein [Candidatus Nitrospira allomarina]